MFVLVPTVITFMVLRFLFRTVSAILAPSVASVAPQLPDGLAALVSFLLIVLLLYLVGEITRHFAGRRMVAWGETVIARLPLAKSVYAATKQVMDTLSPSDQQGFKSVVWVEFPHSGLLTIGFVTGKIDSIDGRPYYKIFVPTSPNPMTGFLEFAPCDEVEEADIDVNEAIKMLLSGGLLSPPNLKLPSRPNRQEQSDQNSDKLDMNCATSHGA